MSKLLKLFSPQYSYWTAVILTPWFGLMATVLMLYGIVGGLFWAPPDYQQGEGFRIIYVHVPAAFLSLAIYTVIFINSVLFLVWRLKVADMIAKVSASIGASYTLIALLTGSLWGKPMWGTWWIWDARLTSELILLFLYLGYLGLRNAIKDPKRAGSACAIMALVGMIDIPIIHFSVEWWATLHQGATLAKLAKPSIAKEMLYPLLAMIGAFTFFYATLLSIRLRTEILKSEWQTNWMSLWLMEGRIK